MTLDNLRVPFMTDGKFKILSFRSKDPVFKTDPGVVPVEEICEKAGITVVQTDFQHNDMRDTGPDEAKASIQGMLDKFLEDDSPLKPVETKTSPLMTDPGRWRSTRRSRTDRPRRSQIDAGSRTFGACRRRRAVDALTASSIPAHISLQQSASAYVRRTDQTEIRRRVSSAQKAASGKAGSLPEAKPSASEDIAAFVAKARAMSPHAAGARGRLVFALDATMSRQPTWDMACALQADMFREAAALGSLDIRLVYYRGLNECRATGWISDSAQLAKLMGKIDCRGGNTQIGKVLSEARREAVASAVRAVVFVGDAMEESGRRALRQGGRTRPAQGAGIHVPGRP